MTAASGDTPFDAILLLSFGGPDGPDDVRPFLENVTRGRGVPPERLDAVAEHYFHFGGVSPINALNLDIIERLRAAGLGDAEIVDVIGGAAFFNWANRLMLSLGEPEVPARRH